MMTSKTTPVFSENINYALGLSLFITLVIGFFVPRLLAFLPVLLGLGFWLNILTRQKTLIKFNKIEIIFVGALLGFMALGRLWSPDPEFSTEKVIKLAVIILPCLLLLAVCKNSYGLPKFKWINFLIPLHIIAAVFLIFEQNTNHLISHFILQKEIEIAQYNRTYIILSLISLITLFMVQISGYQKKFKIVLFLGLLILTLITLVFSQSQTSQLTFLCGLFFLIIFPIQSRLLGKFLFGGIVLLSLTLPFILQPIKNQIPDEVLLQGVIAEASTIQRFEVWDFTITKIKESPLYGHGIEAQRFLKSDTWMEHQKADSILHAHNIILQIWLEFGVIGFLFAAAFLIYCYRMIYAQEDLQTRRLYLTMFTACFCCAMTGYGAWQSWQVGAFFFMTALVVTIRRPLLRD